MFASVGATAGSSGATDPDGTLYLHGDKYLPLASKITLPKITQGPISAKSHGKFVFWDSSGSKAYVIMQADSSAGFLNDFAVYTLSPDFTPGCAVTLGANSGTAISYADTGSIAVGASSDCVWEVKSNVSWIQIDSGTLGVGMGNVSYSVLANPDPTSRVGTITIGDQTFTLTQAGGHPAFFLGETPAGTMYYLKFQNNIVFGYYAYLGGSWIYHMDLGYEYTTPATDGANGVYFWDLSSGHWFYTNPGSFSFLYDFTLNAWLYYMPASGQANHYSNNPRWFKNMTTGLWFNM
jgi:hypothetical protein